MAAMMVTSGYDLTFTDERGPGKHPEFHATHRETGFVVAVEAKSRHRPGIMGYEPEVPFVVPDSCGIDRLLSDAVDKDTEKPLLVFIELNVPAYGTPNAVAQFQQELKEGWLHIASGASRGAEAQGRIPERPATQLRDLRAVHARRILRVSRPVPFFR